MSRSEESAESGAGVASADLQAKVESLRAVLREAAPVLVAFSGGVDSTTLLHVAQQELGDTQVLAVTAHGDVHAGEETAAAGAAAARMGVRHLVLDTHELEVAGFAANPPERCYLCKHALYTQLVQMACELGLKTVIDGANADDMSDYRPGQEAARCLGVRSPLAEVGLGKDDIRALARGWGLPEWNKPSSPCLASRFPYGEPLTTEALAMVAGAEGYLRSLGFETLRVRHHGRLARLELGDAERERLSRAADGDEAGASLRRGIVGHLRGLGYDYVTLDLEGFRSGSLNEVLGFTRGVEEAG